MDFYQSLGNLILGSRLRRLSEYYLAEINKVYQDQGEEFDASWFPLFYILSDNPQISIRDIAERLQVSHSAVSQLVSNLKKKKLLTTSTASEDARIQLVVLTSKGKTLLQRVRPVWDGISQAMNEVHEEHPASSRLLAGINALESGFYQKSLSLRILDALSNEPRCKPHQSVNNKG